MNASAPSLGYFRRKVRAHLERALTLIPNRVPSDVLEDDAATPLMLELQELDMFLHGLGYDERQMEDREHKRERRVAAKQRRPELENVVMLVDHHVQEAMAMLGGDEKSDWVLAPMTAEMVINAFVQFLDQFPATAFAENRFRPSGFPADRDETVAAIVRLMRERAAPTHPTPER